MIFREPSNLPVTVNLDRWVFREGGPFLEDAAKSTRALKVEAIHAIHMPYLPLHTTDWYKGA